MFVGSINITPGVQNVDGKTRDVVFFSERGGSGHARVSCYFHPNNQEVMDVEFKRHCPMPSRGDLLNIAIEAISKGVFAIATFDEHGYKVAWAEEGDKA